MWVARYILYVYNDILDLSLPPIGLTLTAASTVYMLEPSLNPAEEAQALSRTHRIGQVRC